MSRLHLNRPTFIDANGCPTRQPTNVVIAVFVNPSQSLPNPSDPDVFGVVVDKVLKSGNDVCSGTVSSDYLREAIDSVSFIFTLHCLKTVPSSNITNEQVIDESLVGFAFCIDQRLQPEKHDSLYIDVVCANIKISNQCPKIPGGKTIINFVTEYARSLQYKYITLRSLAHVLSYYRRLGFRNIQYGADSEDPAITELFKLNANSRFDEPIDVDNAIRVEKAMQLAVEIDDTGKPELNEQLLAKNLQKEFAIPDKLDDEDVIEFIALIPDYVSDEYGRNGYYDLLTLLANRGFAGQECSAVTRRMIDIRVQNVDDNDMAPFIQCLHDGFYMRKPLFTTPNDPSISKPIINCFPSGGRRRIPTKHSTTKKRNVAKHRLVSKKKSHKNTKKITNK